MPHSVFFIFSSGSNVSPRFLCSLVVNVMQRDSIPSEVDYETRQGVYSICLQLARYKSLKRARTRTRTQTLWASRRIRLHAQLVLLAGFFWLVRACLHCWTMTSSGTARLCHPVHFATPDGAGDSCLFVEPQRSRLTDRYLCLSALP